MNLFRDLLTNLRLGKKKDYPKYTAHFLKHLNHSMTELVLREEAFLLHQILCNEKVLLEIQHISRRVSVVTIEKYEESTDLLRNIQSSNLRGDVLHALRGDESLDLLHTGTHTHCGILFHERVAILYPVWTI